MKFIAYFNSFVTLVKSLIFNGEHIFIRPLKISLHRPRHFSLKVQRKSHLGKWYHIISVTKYNIQSHGKINTGCNKCGVMAFSRRLFSPCSIFNILHFLSQFGQNDKIFWLKVDPSRATEPKIKNENCRPGFIESVHER